MTVAHTHKLFFVVLMLAVGAVHLHVPAQQKSTLDDSEVLARIGPRNITVRDYVERLELMPWPGKDDPAAQDSAKIKALLALVAEKVLSMEAADLGFIQNQNTSSLLKTLERVLARDELYRLEVLGNITVEPEELAAGLRRYASILRLNTFRMNSGENANRLMRSLNARPESTRVPFSSEGVLSHDTITVSFGDLVQSFEDTVYALEIVHEARAAFDPEVGWTVFQLVDRYTNPAYASANMQDRQSAVQQKIKKRKEGILAARYSRKLFTSRIQMDSLLFRVVADSLFAIVQKDTGGHRQGNSFGVRDDDIDNLKRSLASRSETPFITMEDYTISLDEMIDELRFHPVRFPSLRKRPFLQTLNNDIRQIAEAGLASAAAMKLRINQRPEVQRDLNVWVDAMQAEKLLKHLIDSLARAYAIRPSGGAGDDSVRAHAAIKATAAINAYLGRLADKYAVEMNFAALKHVPILPSNMVTRRFVGFGGSMMAVPMMMQLGDWWETWKQAAKISP